MPKGTDFKRAVNKIFGNPRGLAVLLVSTLAIAGGFQLENYGHTNLASGSIGASVSLLVALIVSIIETPLKKQIDMRYIHAAEREAIEKVRYERRNLEFSIRYRKENSDARQVCGFDIVIDCELLLLTDGETTVDRISVEPPAGLKATDRSKHTIDGNNVKDEGFPLVKNANERFCISYELDGEILPEYSDDHIWASPVANYRVKLYGGDEFVCFVSELIRKDPPRISRAYVEDDGTEVFRGPGAAFSRQGVRWRFEKS